MKNKCLQTAAYNLINVVLDVSDAADAPETTLKEVFYLTRFSKKLLKFYRRLVKKFDIDCWWE